jgi:3-hydroxyacyl-CoA dehydrogenase / 3-hydroxy-2-methylbutyryl-CoA dehydrogenase
VRLAGAGALVAGGASGLGAATAHELVEQGARVAVVDRDGERAAELAARLGADGDAASGHRTRAPLAIALEADVTDEARLGEAVGDAVEALGELRLAVSCAGIGWAERTVGRDGPAALAPFETVVGVNLIGSFNVLRLTAAVMAGNEPGEDGERGAVVMTASIAAFDGQIGQAAYAASKGGVASLTLPAARDLARQGIRVCTIAPGTFDTPLLAALPDARRALGDQVPFPARLGHPHEFAQLACHIAENPMLNGETIRLDGALRMPPR